MKRAFTSISRNIGRRHVPFYDRDLQKLPFARHYPVESVSIEKTKNYEKMVQLAEVLTAPLKFARVDFYDIDGKIDKAAKRILGMHPYLYDEIMRLYHMVE